MVPPLIALEEHFLSSAVLDAFDEQYQEQFRAIPAVKSMLEDIGDLRLSEMDKGKVAMQVVSHACAPGGPSPKQCREGNDQMAASISKNRERFAGFAALPVADPNASAKELERAVKELGFVGALIDNHVDGQYYDGSEYDCMWQKAEELDVPIYLHPTWPAEDMTSQYTGNFTPGAGRSLGASGWGWHADTGLHILRLYASGCFDKFPRLKIIIGHFGEMLPFMLERVSNLSVRWGEQHRKLKQVWDENIWITTSGVWSLDPLRCILGNTKIEHILYSVDYPFQQNENGLKWIEELEQSGLVTQEELEMIAYKNSEKLLRIKAPR
ncbi:related to 5-carboxyvanillate decarboxylase [Ramularia collo-cygni]|uniref:Related to 5-carboxyvanillate decarboxylase n=1 Tax=Ramularia collo-cygni TaxID=112498 RepID=A0A2D3UZQ1_9PEZI|nr:related to 5-carboxyvanillate decarboxylase [Ramularia collo-cygni]CZT22401.1 related to 5-carboxyvanillate decarboxylase [Ramularia collo-cygni]